MRIRLLLIAVALGLALITPGPGRADPAAAPPPGAPPGAPPGTASYWFGLIHRGPMAATIDSTELAGIQAAHMANIRRLSKAGKLVLAGPFLDDGELRGIFVYRAASREEAEALVASDPAVQAGRLAVELHPWLGPKVLDRIPQLFEEAAKSKQ